MYCRIMPRLTTEQRAEVIVRKQQGQSYTAIAAMFNMSRTAVINLVKKQRESGSVLDRSKSGRRRATTVRQDRHIVRASMRNRRLTAVDLQQQLAASGTCITARTVRNRLREVGLHGRIAAKKPLLSKTNKKKRMEFAKRYRNWTADDWKGVLWSDESSVEVFGSRQRQYVRRRKGERYQMDCVMPSVKFGGGKMMVWGCFSGYGLGGLYRTQGTMDQNQYKTVLQDIMIPSASRLFGRRKFLFQQDNAPCHKARSVMDFLTKKKVDIMDWPPQSPDFNPIENLWDILKRQVAQSKPSGVNDLWEKLQETWNNITLAQIDRLMQSMPRRMQQAITARGGCTKY